MLAKGVILKVKYTTRRISFAKGQAINKCYMDSSESQKGHFLQPVQFCLSKLFFARRTFLCRNYMKVLIFRGTFNFHKYFLKYRV
jgi:hypothetical protein